MRKGIILIFIIFSVFIMASACNTDGTKTEPKGNETNGTTISGNTNYKNTEKTTNDKNDKRLNIDEQGIKNFILKFLSSIKNDDSKGFKELLSDDGIFSISYYIDQRDPNVVIHVNKDLIRSDLILVDSNNKAGITLSTMFAGDDAVELEKMPIHTSELLSNMSFNVQWKSKDEGMIMKYLEDIVQTCQKINLVNNEDISQVFVLKDNMFAFAKSSGVLKPSPEFTGDWVIFEKVGSEYKLRAVMQFQ